MNSLPQLALRFIVALFHDVNGFTPIIERRRFDCLGFTGLQVGNVIFCYLWDFIPDYCGMSKPNPYPTFYQPTGPQWDVLREFYPWYCVLNYLFLSYNDVSTSRRHPLSKTRWPFETCINSCQKAGYIYAGVEFGCESSLKVYVVND